MKSSEDIALILGVEESMLRQELAVYTNAKELLRQRKNNLATMKELYISLQRNALDGGRHP